jgi:DUF4097 and DUF4098 domain-containing protein YvlB
MNRQRFGFRSLHVAAAIVALILSSLWASAAENNDGNRVVVPITDPTRPATVRAHLVNGSITVKGYDGKDVIVETHARGREHPEAPENSGGLRRIPQTATGLSVDSENNEINLKMDALHQDVSFTITVPHRTSLTLSTVDGGNIMVSDVEGELDVNNVNGSVTLNHVSGSAVAHALNGRLVATFARVDPRKPMAFSSMNGNIDVTLPPDVKANLSLRTDNGGIYSDFEIQLQPAAPPQSPNEDGKGGKYTVGAGKTLHATLNGGGPEIQIKDFNGNIYIRKAGK